MTNRTLVNAAMPLLAAAIMTFQARDALPAYPLGVPWPMTISWLGLFGAALMFFVWFSAITGLAARASRHGRFIAGPLYVLYLLVGSAAFAAPLLLAYSVLLSCRAGLDCGIYVQGFFQVLETVGRHASILSSLAISIAIVGASVLMSRANDRLSSRG